MKPKGINWDEQPLGEVSDGALARLLRVAKHSVATARNRRGIPPHSPGNNKGIIWDEQPLGEVSDGALARLLRVAKNSVVTARNKRGIPPHSPGKGIIWDEQPLGKIGDSELGRRLGRSQGCVRNARIRRGIPKYTYPCKCCGASIVYGAYCNPCSRHALNVRIRNPELPEGLQLLKTKETMIRNLTPERVATRRKRHGEDKNDE